jgi:hypothetical protein
MNVLEKEIEEMIWQGLNEDRKLLIRKGLVVWEDASYYRQLDLGSYGISDIIGFHIEPKINGYRTIRAHVIEIKKEEINNATFFQGLRYAKAITRIIEGKFNNTTCVCGITLIGKTVDSASDFIYLPDIMSNVALYTYKLDFKYGLYFSREEEYSITNERLPNAIQFKQAAISMLSDQIKGPKAEELAF